MANSLVGGLRQPRVGVCWGLERAGVASKYGPIATAGREGSEGVAGSLRDWEVAPNDAEWWYGGHANGLEPEGSDAKEEARAMVCIIELRVRIRVSIKE